MVIADLVPALRSFLRAPLLWFCVIGGVLFAADAYRLSRADTDRQIAVSSGQIAALAAQWQSQMGGPPSADALRQLIADHADEEMLYREALRMGLDRDDAVVRRRLAQKVRFLMEDAEARGPDEQALAAFHAAHAADYRLPERRSFRQVFISTDKRTDAEAEARAATVLAQLTAGTDARGVGDAFMLRSDYVEQTTDDIAELFGGDFAAAVAGLEVGAWFGPIRSPLGLHLVHVERVLPATDPSLGEIAERVRSDYRDRVRQVATEAWLKSLRERYVVTVDADATTT